MRIITTQNLKFIDNYLKKSEIFYDDIRMELTDHIASAVEQKMQTENSDFYDAFKSYMNLNKKELLNKFMGGNLNFLVPFKNFRLFLIQPHMILFGLFFYAGVFFFQTTIDIEAFIYEFHFCWFLFIICFTLFHMGYFLLIKKKRFYVIEQSFLVLVVIHYFFIFFSKPIAFNQLKFIFWMDISILFFSIIFLLFYVNQVKKYYHNKHIWN